MPSPSFRSPVFGHLWGLLGIALFVAFWSESLLAQAEQSVSPLLIDFSYRAPAQCPSSEGAYALVHRRSGRIRRAHGSQSSQQLSMEVVFDGARYRGKLTVVRRGHPPETRTMTGEQCSEVVEALALTAALSIDPDATLTLGPVIPEESSRSSAEAPTTMPSDQPTAVRAPRPRPTRPQESRAKLGISLALSGEALRVMTHTTHIGVGMALAASRADDRTFFPAEMSLALKYVTEPTSRGQTVFSRFFFAQLSYCPLRVGRNPAFLLCPSSQVGVLWASGRGLQEEELVSRFFATIGAEGWVRARLSRHVELSLVPGLQIPLTERRFVTDPDGEELTSSVSVGWNVAARIAWVF